VSHFAKINNNIVTEVLVSEKDFILTQHNGGVGWYKQTSYNGTFRKNYAGIGYIYDATRDAFIAPQPYPSWTLNEDTCQWDSPVSYPTDDKRYTWDEETTNWKEVI
jgi:hypothetical protein